MKKIYTIFGMKVKIRAVPEIIDENGRALAGHFDPNKKEIVLSLASNSDEEQLRTLCHELAHALMYRVGLFQTRMTSDHHELVSEAFGNWIYEEFFGEVAHKKWAKLRKTLL
jgi:Zn-dependent peptidase ImmA (M78 family)